jgi:hypothetical protein
MTTEQKKIQLRTMIQLRVSTFVDHKFRQALNSVYVDEVDVEKVIDILLEAQEKIKELNKK